MGVGGAALQYDPPYSYWAQPQPSGGGAAPYHIMSGVEVDNSKVVVNMSVANGGGGGFVFMKQTHDWGSWVFEINSTTPSTDGVGARIQFGKGGQQEARGTADRNQPLANGGGGFYISHRREYLDLAGEWYFNATSNALFLAVAAGAPPPSTVVASVVEELFQFKGTKAGRNLSILSLSNRESA